MTEKINEILAETWPELKGKELSEEEEIFLLKVDVARKDSKKADQTTSAKTVDDLFLATYGEMIESMKKPDMTEKELEEFEANVKMLKDAFVMEQSEANTPAEEIPVNKTPDEIFQETYGDMLQGMDEKDIDRLRNCDKNFFNEIHGNEINLTGKVNNTTCVVWRIATNIFDYIEEDLKRLEKKKKELTNEIVEVQQEKTKALLGFDLNIENIYNLIFAHIDTFMHKYYDVLKETSINDGRNKLLCNYKQNICDVPSKVLEQGKVPPYPAIVAEKDKKKILVWPTKILQEEIAETNFVNRIIAASLQLSDDLEKAREVMAEYAKSSVKSMEYGVDKLIPTNIVDFFIDEVKTNPYEECVNSFKKDGGNVNKIWFVFAMRCLYFVLMFRKYRTETPLNKDISNICNMFAINEVTNIRKAFGDDMTRQLLTDITNKKKSEFFKFLVNEISSTIEDNNYNLAYGNNYYLTKFNFLQNFNSTTILNGYKYKITIDEENYSVIPVRNINKEKLQTDIENGNCLNNKDYIIIKNNGDIIEDRLFNEKTIKVYENIPKLFGNYISLIQGDETYKDVSNGYSEKNSEVLEDMLKNYLGSNIIENNAIEKYFQQIMKIMNISLTNIRM